MVGDGFMHHVNLNKKNTAFACILLVLAKTTINYKMKIPGW